MQYDSYITWVFLFMLFGIFWILAFLDAIQKFVVAATTCIWYFSGNGSDNADKKGTVSMCMTFKWAIFYHMGTMAFGGFLIALVSMVKVIFEYFAKKAEASGATKNPLVKAIVCCARCAICLLDHCVKFINKNAYIQCALFSTTFCKSAQEGFYLFIRHSGKFTGIDITGLLISLLGKGIIIALNVYITILCLKSYNVSQPYVISIIVGVISFVIATLFLSIFEFSSMAILHCFILDSDVGGSTKTPDSLKEFLDLGNKMIAAKARKQKTLLVKVEVTIPKRAT